MPLVHARRPLKRWRYVGVYGPELMLCVADARVGGIRQRWWAVALPDGTLVEGTRGVELTPGRARVRGVLDLELDEPGGVEVVSPDGRSYIWTRKSAPVFVRGSVTAGGRRFELDGDDGFVDESAGYHARHTAWRWSAGVGRTDDGRRVAWNLVDGVHDGVTSERTVWLDGEPREVPLQEFADGPLARRRARLPRMVGPRVADEPARVPEQLQAAFRRVQRRAPVRNRARRGLRGDGGA